MDELEGQRLIVINEGCKHEDVQPVGDGHWGKCMACGEEDFPITAYAAGEDADPDNIADKALRFDLDRAGIERREAEAVELVALRARVAELERLRIENACLRKEVRYQKERVKDLRNRVSRAHLELQQWRYLAGQAFSATMLRSRMAKAAKELSLLERRELRKREDSAVAELEAAVKELRDKERS